MAEARPTALGAWILEVRDLDSTHPVGLTDPLTNVADGDGDLDLWYSTNDELRLLLTMLVAGLAKAFLGRRTALAHPVRSTSGRSRGVRLATSLAFGSAAP